MKLPRSLGFFDSAGSRKHSPFAHPPVSAMLAGTAPPARKLFLSKLYSPAYASPVNASPACYQVSTHDSGSKWVASPSSSGTFIQYFMSVYPDAFADSYNAWGAAPYQITHCRSHLQVANSELRAGPREDACIIRSPSQGRRKQTPAIPRVIKSNSKPQFESVGMLLTSKTPPC